MKIQKFGRRGGQKKNLKELNVERRTIFKKYIREGESIWKGLNTA
jgi:hypothetical protein